MRLDQLFAAPRRKGSKTPAPVDDEDGKQDEDEFGFDDDEVLDDLEDKEDEVAVVEIVLDENEDENEEP